MNHYKARFLSRLAQGRELDITVPAGAEMREKGHKRHREEEAFTRIDLNAAKENFHLTPAVYFTLFQLVSRQKYDVVLMPLEKKHIPLIMFLFVLKLFFRYKLVSYNHPSTRGSSLGPSMDRFITKSLFALYDRVIFYTREGMDLAVDSKFLPLGKAFFANNTLDTEGIWKHYEFEINRSAAKVILFIGRLIANKRLDLLFKYFEQLKKSLPGVRLNIIGDGPEAPKVKLAVENDDSITWQGAVVDEVEIARHMRAAHLVFVPGWSGLSIVHALCYGKPYVTIAGPHPPEIDYLRDGENGLILRGDIIEDCARITELLTDQDNYDKMCRAAFDKAKELSVEEWCSKMINALVK